MQVSYRMGRRRRRHGRCCFIKRCGTVGHLQGLRRGRLRAGRDGRGPVHAVPKLLSKAGLSGRYRPLGDQRGLRLRAAVRDARARDRSTKAGVNGGSIAIGHPLDGGGARQVGHILAEGQRRKAKHVVVSVQCPYFSSESPMTQPTADGRIINPFLTRPMSKDV